MRLTVQSFELETQGTLATLLFALGFQTSVTALATLWVLSVK